LADRRCELRPAADTVGGRGLPALLIAAVTTLSLLLLAFSGCRASTPEATVTDFIKARIAGDEERAAELTVEGDLEDFIGGEVFLAGSGVEFDVSRADVDGTRAVVTARFHWDDQVVDIPYVCEREGTKWLVALRETEGLWLEEYP
jgi:hypothetical protein